MAELTEITVEWFVTMFHKFKVRPEKGERLLLVKECQNKFDPYAILVKQKNNDEVVGRVPSNFCRLLIKMKRAGITKNFTCVFSRKLKSQNPKGKARQKFQII